MATPTFTIDDATLEDFDDIILQQKANGDLDRDTTRSQLIRELVEEYVAEHRGVIEEEEAD
jgi:metal-responsive CopG/Arc/MetJ family transcriptional regulator